ncbi:hypothetical protein BH11MYX4_BH11MYX4_53490 [soil metagenome]
MKNASLAFLAAVALVACATGTATNDVTDDLALNGSDGGREGGAVLPPSTKTDAASEPDQSDAAVPDGGLDGALDAAKDAGVDSSTTSGACGAGSAQLGEYATWSGKVNVHRTTGGTWLVDSDCSSGANVNTVAYCQKLWPTTTKQVQLAAVTSDTKPFTSAAGSAPACGGVALSPGQAQFACCVP